MTSMHHHALRLLSRATHTAYMRREKQLAAPGPQGRTLSILFAQRPHWERALRAGFDGLPHRLHFEDLRHADLERHDLIVPLSPDDANLLRRQPPYVRERVLALPDESCTALCDDKPRLNRLLGAAGFGAHIPPIGDGLAPPYVSKPSSGLNRDECRLVSDVCAEVRLAAKLRRPGLLRQAAVPGAVEHETHFVMRDGVLLRELTVLYHHDTPFAIEDTTGCTTTMRRLGHCPDPATLTGMLHAVGYEGLGCANYKMNEGRLQLLDIKPRVSSSLCDYFFSFLRSMPSAQRTRNAGCTNWTWLDSMVERESVGLA